MEDQIRQLNISKKSYGLILGVLFAFVINGGFQEIINQSIEYYAMFNAFFYSLMCVMIYSVFSDIIHSPKSMSLQLRKKLKSRLYAVVFILMPIVALIDMKAAMIENNWFF
jgi:hypothetical protein